MDEEKERAPQTSPLPSTPRPAKRSNSNGRDAGRDDDAATTLVKTSRPSARRASTMRETSQRAQEALQGQGTEELMNMMRTLMANTTAHFVSTDEKLDNILEPLSTKRGED